MRTCLVLFKNSKNYLDAVSLSKARTDFNCEIRRENFLLIILDEHRASLLFKFMVFIESKTGRT
jgi:hypothetical protein